MIGTTRQGAHEVLADVAPVAGPMWRALEKGTHAGAEYFDALGQPIERFLYSSIVRFHARLSLDGEGLFSADDPSPVTREPLANIGLLLHFREYSIRILKAANGSLRPARSIAMQGYCEQLALFSQDVDSMNLIVIWDATVDGALASVKLVCPRYAPLKKASVSVHWMIDVPHPAETMSVDSLEHVDDDDVLDIPIERLEDSDA